MTQIASLYSLEEFPVKLQMHIIIFNIIIVFMLLVSVFFPIFFLGLAPGLDFLRTVWPLGLVFVVLPAVANVFFITNRRLFALLEREDWPALADYLEKKLCQDGRYSSRYVQLFVQSCLAIGHFDRAVEFSEKIYAVKPALVEANALIFGIVYILNGNTALTVKFYRDRLEKARSAGKRTEWLRWYYGFSLTLTSEAGQAGAVFEGLAISAHDIPVSGLSAFFLSKMMKNNPQLSINAENGRDRVRKAFKTIDRWNDQVAKLKTKAHGASIKEYLDEAGQWLFGESAV
jgi:hypothetical protein